MLKSALLTSCIFLNALTGQAQSALEIVHSYVQAIGGSQAVKAIGSKYQESGLESPNGEVVTKNYWSRKGLYRDEMTYPDGNVFTRLVKKESGQIKMGENPAEAMSPEMHKDLLLNEADIDGMFVDFEAKGHSCALAGTERIGTSDAYKIIVTLSNGSKQTYWFDKTSHLIVKYQRVVISAMGEVELNRELSDYRAVAGVKFPFLFQSTFGQNAYTTKIKAIKINEPVSPEIFDALK